MRMWLDHLTDELTVKIFQILSVRDIMATRETMSDGSAVRMELERRLRLYNWTPGLNESIFHLNVILKVLSDSRQLAWMPIAAAGTEGQSLVVRDDGMIYSFSPGVSEYKLINVVEMNGQPVRFRSVHSTEREDQDDQIICVNVAISEKGDIYTWGNGYDDWFFSLLGREGGANHDTIPTYAPGLHRVATLALGYDHCLAVDDLDRVYTWGKGTHGRCGHVDEHGNPLEYIYKPERLHLGGHGTEYRTAAACGAAAGIEHSLVVAADGTVWAFGGNSSGQLGVFPGDGVNTYQPRIVSFSNEPEHTVVKVVAAGGNHSIALTDTGAVFCWGDNVFRQVGMAQVEELHSIDAPVRVRAFNTGVICIAAGYNNSFAVTDIGSLYTWGSVNDNNTGDTIAYTCSLPEIVRPLFGEGVVAVSVPKRYGQDHTMVVTRTGKVMGCMGGAVQSIYMKDEHGNITESHNWVTYSDIACKRISFVQGE